MIFQIFTNIISSYRNSILFLAAAFIVTCGCETGSSKVSWTIMFYANGDNNLENSILSDIKEMELSTPPENITIIALVDRPSSPSLKFGGWSDTRLFRITHSDDTDTLASEELDSAELSLTTGEAEELNMNDASTISKFISFCKSNYPSDKYALIIGSHGDGWRFPSIITSKSIGYDSTSHNNSTSIDVLSSVLKLNPLNVIIFDACNMGNIETLYDMSGCADYIVASPNPLPLSGFNYSDVISSLDSSMDAERFSLAFSSSYERIHDNITMMVYDMNMFSEIIQSGSSFLSAISHASLSDPETVITARNESIRYSVNGISDHIDIVDYSKKIMIEENIPFDSFILTKNTPRLSFYFPASYEMYDASYNYTSFAEGTSWDETLTAILQ